MKKLKLGLQLYSIRQHIQNEADFAETMKKVADIGYKYVQVSAIGDVSAECIKRECEKNGLRVILTHWNPAKMRTDIDTVICDHDIFGCDAIGLGGLYIYNEPGKPFDFGSYAKFKEEFAPIVAKIKAAGKKFVYHNHRFEFEKHNGKIDLVHLMDENPDVDLVFDTYWSQAGGYDPALFIRKYGDRIHTVHLKDMKIVADKQQFTEILEGNINFDSVIEACLDKNIEYLMVEQDEIEMEDRFESVKLSYDNLMKRYGDVLE